LTADAAPARPSPRSRKPVNRLSATIGGLIVLAIIVFLILFRWNWLRGPLAHVISGQLNRPVHIIGNLEVHPWSWSPRATVNGLIIGNAPWAPRTPLATFPRLTVQIRILPLFQGKTILPLVEADNASLDLLRDDQGRANWNFHPGRKPKPLQLPAIDNLIIKNGAVRYLDAKHHLDFAGTISSDERINGHGQGSFMLDGKGSLNTARFLAHIVGGPLINVDPSRAYPFDAHISAGSTNLRLVGHIAHPFNFAQMSGKMAVSGLDLADLYYLTGLTFPNSPPYSLEAGFGRDDAVYALRRLTGRLGESDLNGQITIDNTSGRPDLTGDLYSRHLRFADLTALFGGAPKKGSSTVLSPQQKIVSAKLTAEHRIFPDTHLDVTRMRTMDARVKFRAATIEAGKIPVRALGMTMTLEKGVLDVAPLDLILPQGHLTGTVHLDARQTVPTEAIDMRLTNARLATLAPWKTGGPPAIDGQLYGRAKLTSRGDSVRSAAAGSNGAVTMVVTQGEIRQALAELMGIDATKGLFLLLSKNKGDTPIRCGVVDFRARDGVLTADRIILDTGVVLVTGSGDVDLRDETMNFVLNGKPKKFRLVRINAPITISGGLTSPKIGVQLAKAAPQVLLGVAIGVFAAPVAAILPFVEPGLAKNADCAGLMEQASEGPAPIRKHQVGG
jgi:uncharacterized protein involved in outer membrane biogenesis